MKTHYDVLNLDKDCSAKEIKESFIKLSKKYHPDKNRSSDAHRKFVEVNEAYSVLGKATSRHIYDEKLSCEKSRVVYKNYTNTKTAYENYSEMYAQNIRRSQDSSTGYITGSKIKAVCFCFFLMAIGSGLQLISETRRRIGHSHQIAVKLKESKDRLRQEKKRREMEQAKHREDFDSLNAREQ